MVLLTAVGLTFGLIFARNLPVAQLWPFIAILAVAIIYLTERYRDELF